MAHNGLPSDKTPPRNRLVVALVVSVSLEGRSTSTHSPGKKSWNTLEEIQ